jgi:ribonucleoside-triphosphate reductase
MCFIGQIVVVGGVRRSAMISLSNLSDDRMRHAKSGQWWETAAHRALANNSVSYTEKPDVETFMREWLALVESKSGERGVFNREASKKQAAKYGRRDPNHDFGTNPCSEIILRPYQFCNLTEVVVRATDSVEDLERKVKSGNNSGDYPIHLH